MRPLERRRFIAITAAAAGCSLVPLRPGMARAPGTVTWRGQALGAAASLVIHHDDRAAAERLVRQVVAEVERLEGIFSLYRPDSALSQLNQQGALASPPPDMVALLDASREFWELSDGAFDPTVQPLWAGLAEHFSRSGADPAGPPPARMRETLALVGFDKVVFNRDRVAFRERGMGLTLNGIAQGYITDRAVDILRLGGIEKSLVDLGEIRALGSRPDGAPWRVGIAEEGADPMPELEIEDKAVATSSSAGFRFDTAGRFNHLLDPASGTSADLYRSTTVIAPSAAAADALSTAFNFMPRGSIEKVLARRTELQARLVDRHGARIAL